MHVLALTRRSARRISALAALCLLPVLLLCGEPAATFDLAGDWRINVSAARQSGPPIRGTVEVEPAQWHVVKGQRIASLPMFNPNAGGWAKGAALPELRAQECSSPRLLDPASVEIRRGPESDSPLLKPGTDFEIDLVWATLGRVTNSPVKEGEPVFASYRHALFRLDSIVLTADGRILLKRGEPKPAAPEAPPLDAGERRLANVWLPGLIARLTPENILPLLESEYPEPPRESPSQIEKCAPRAWSKILSGEKLRILAWGDSVTVGTYLPDYENQRWQVQFVNRLRARFPKAQIELVTEAWGGRSTASYLGEPPGSEHNFKEKVLDARPDLVISEFVNDAGLNEAAVEEHYGRLLESFRGISAEWIILTPHYVRPDWMNLNRERDIDEDPRPYVRGLRQFAAKHGVALADASLRYGRLWRQGLPYSTLMLNAINHPNAHGMRLFADSLMALFPETAGAP
jgi:lysophospholipase L1-like esterase